MNKSNAPGTLNTAVANGKPGKNGDDYRKAVEEYTELTMKIKFEIEKIDALLKKYYKKSPVPHGQFLFKWSIARDESSSGVDVFFKNEKHRKPEKVNVKKLKAADIKANDDSSQLPNPVIVTYSEIGAPPSGTTPPPPGANPNP